MLNWYKGKETKLREKSFLFTRSFERSMNFPEKNSMRRIFALGEKEMEGEVALTALDSIQKENLLGRFEMEVDVDPLEHRKMISASSREYNMIQDKFE